MQVLATGQIVVPAGRAQMNDLFPPPGLKQLQGMSGGGNGRGEFPVWSRWNGRARSAFHG
jgi:hypothetical protein